MRRLFVFADRVRRHWSDPTSHDRRIAMGVLWVTLFVFIGKLAGAAKEMAIAWRFGISDTVDAYVFVFNLVTWPLPVWFGLLSAVLVPLVARLRRESPAQLGLFRGELLALTMLLGLAALAFSYFLLPTFLESKLAGLSPAVAKSAVDAAVPLSWLLPFGLAIGLFSAWTLACGRHRNTLLEAVPASTILIALVLPQGSVPEPLIWGTVVGYLLHLGMLVWPLARSGEISVPSLKFGSSAWPDFRYGMRVLVLGYVLMSVTTIIDQFFAARLETGAIATLNYANRILALVLSLGSLAINRATLPVFSEAASHGPIDRLAGRWAKWMFIGGLATSLFLWGTAPWVVKLVFERGAFHSDDTVRVSELLKLLLIQVPFYFWGIVLVSALTSRKDYVAVTVSGVIGVVCRPLVNAILVPRMGIEGIAVSAAVGYAATSAYMAIRMRRP